MAVACGEIQVMLSCQSEQHGGESSEGSQSMLHSDKNPKAQTTLFAQRALQEQRRLKPPDTIIACPRCQSLNTKFCYYNNYSLTQPRHFCKNCRRYWTAGGTLRNVPVGGGCRKNKRAKRNNELSSVLTSGESVSVSRNDGTSSALHPPFNPGSASTSANYYDHPFEEAKIALARVQHAVRAGPSGVSQSMDGISSNGHVSPFHVSHGSHSTGMSHSAQSSFEAPVVPSIISLGSYYQPQVKPEVAVLANGDLSAIFESQSYRAAAAAAASGGVSALGEGGITYNIDMEALNNIDPGHVDVQWRLHQHVQQQQAAAAAQKQQQAMWGEEDQGHREGRQPLHNAAPDEKGLMESLRQAKGKSAIAVSPSSGHEQAAEGPEVSRPLGGVPNWQQGPPESMQSLEQQDNAFWSNQSWAPLDIHALNPPSNSQIL